ncbi:uncharacterized protein [Macrobrachium rosenbergii]|uniref:uncharacterized protein n=1 Tax=Macrobrachium rosenbergii TaxID=79674 RepID=UPI0034D60763
MLPLIGCFRYTNNCSDKQQKNSCSLMVFFIVFLQHQHLSQLFGVSAAPHTVLVHEDCPSTVKIISNYKPSSLAGLVPLPCGAQEPPTSALVTLSSKAAQNGTFFIVVASCGVVSSLSPPLRSPTVVPQGRMIPVPTSGQRCRGRKRGCGALGEPLRNVLNLAACWMTYNMWSQVVVFYDGTLDAQANADLVGNFLNYCFFQGFKLSFINTKESPDGGNSDGHRDALIEAALANWDTIDAKHMVVIAGSESVSALLQKIPRLNNSRNQSSYEWLMITSVKTDVIDAWTPTNGHQVYFADAPLKDLSVALSNAVRTSEALARADSTCSDVAKHPGVRLPSIAVSIKPPDYSSTLIPPVVIPRRGPRLVATHSYVPTLGGIGGVGGVDPSDVGSFQSLSPNEGYQLYGAHLLVATLSSEPFIRALDTINLNSRDPEATKSIKNTSAQIPLPSYVKCSQPEGFEGFLVDLLNILSVEMNFTYSIYEVCDKSYGSIINDTWTGMVGEVVYGRAHIGLGNLGANYARSHAVSFPSISTSHGGAGIIFRRPPEAAKDLLSVFLLPFSLQVWICVLVIMPVCAIALHLTMLPRKRLYNQLKGRAPGMFPESLDVLDQLTRGTAEFWEKGKMQPIQVKTTDHRPQGQDTVREAKKEQVLTTETSGETDVRELNGSFADSLWFAATMMMQQGQDAEPKSGPGRIVFGTSWIMSVVLFAAYTSNLVSFFTVTKMTLPFHNLAELVNTDYKFGTRTGSVYINNFEVSGNEYATAYRKLMSFGKDVLMPSYEAALKRTLEGNYAFIGDYVVLDYYQKKDCNLVLLKQQLFETKSSLILPRDSPLLPAVNHFMALMSESGIMEKLRSRWWRAETCDEGLMVTSYESISILEVSSALLIMAFGVVMAAVVCMCEFCRSKCKAKTVLHPKETKSGQRIILPRQEPNSGMNSS